MGALENVTYFKLTLPFVDRSVTDEWDAAELNYTFKEKTIDWTGYLLNMLPWLLLIGFWIFMIRRMQGGAGGMKGIFNFGKSRASLWTSDQPAVTFKDVSGCEEAKDELKEVIGFLKDPKRFQKLGATVPKGALLIGPPGTGKTLLARAVAGEASVPFYSLSGADFVEMFVGVGASRVRDLFEQAKKTTPCIIFIDELDAVGRQRGAGIGGGHDEREQTLNALLVEMDGFDNTQNVIVIAATNRPDVLDKALLRPGRFDRQIMVDVPDYIGRLGILKVHTKKVVLNRRKVDLESLAKGTPGMVGADLANIVNEAALLAARKRKRSIDNDDFEEAKDKVMMGIQRKSMVLSEEEKEVTAYHEAGHALVAMRTKGADPVHKISILPTIAFYLCVFFGSLFLIAALVSSLMIISEFSEIFTWSEWKDDIVWFFTHGIILSLLGYNCLAYIRGMSIKSQKIMIYFTYLYVSYFLIDEILLAPFDGTGSNFKFYIFILIVTTIVTIPMLVIKYMKKRRAKINN